LSNQKIDLANKKRRNRFAQFPKKDHLGPKRN
jgi:hypothetical protein